MSLTTTASTITYECNGTAAFPVPFRFLAPGDLVVAHLDVNGAEEPLELGVDYTVTGAGGPAGGTVTLLDPFDVGTLRIDRVVPVTQPLALQSGNFSPTALEAAFDRATMVLQQLKTLGDRELAQAIADEDELLRAAIAAGDAALSAGYAAGDQAVRSELLQGLAGLNGTSHELADVSSVLAFGSLTPRTLTTRYAETYNVKDYGAIGDGILHPLSEFYASLAAAQVDYPAARDLTDSIDWAAIQLVLNKFTPLSSNSLSGPRRILIPQGRYMINRQLEASAPAALTIKGIGFPELRWCGPNSDDDDATITRYVGDGVTKTFAVPFAFWDPTHLEVIQWTGAAPPRGTRFPSGYTAGAPGSGSFNTTGGNGAPGTITYGVAPAVGVVVTIQRRQCSVLKVAAGYRCHFADFGIACQDGTRGYAGIHFAGYLGGNHLTRVSVWGWCLNTTDQAALYGQSQFDYGFKLTQPDANNDHFDFFQTFVVGARFACYSFRESQSKSHKFYGAWAQARSDHPRLGWGVESGGSFYWYGGAGGSNASDFYMARLGGGESIVIDGFNSEGSRRAFGGELWSVWAPGVEYANGYDRVINGETGEMYACSRTGLSKNVVPTGAANFDEGDEATVARPAWTYLGNGFARIVDVSSVAICTPVEIRNYRFSTGQESATWQPSTAYVAGATIVSKGSRKHYTCITGGVSAAAGVGPNTVGYRIADGTCVWEYSASHGVQIDGIEELNGDGPIVMPRPTAARLDPTLVTSKSIGWYAPVLAAHGGVRLVNSNFIVVERPGQPKLRTKVWASRGLVMEGCYIAGTNPGVYPVVGMHGPGKNAGEPTNYAGPYNGLASNQYPIILRSNFVYRWGGDYGLEAWGQAPMYQDFTHQGAGKWLAPYEWQTGGPTLAIGSYPPDVVRRKLNADLTLITCAAEGGPRPQGGRTITFVFEQGTAGGNHFAVGGWDANFLLSAGPFVMPRGDNQQAAISFVYDSIRKLWVETSRTENAGGMLSGTGSPEGVWTAPVGTLFRRTDGAAGTTIYVKESGAAAAGWRALGQAAARADAPAYAGVPAALADAATRVDLNALGTIVNDLLAKLRAAGILAP